MFHDTTSLNLHSSYNQKLAIPLQVCFPSCAPVRWGSQPRHLQVPEIRTTKQKINCIFLISANIIALNVFSSKPIRSKQFFPWKIKLRLLIGNIMLRRAFLQVSNFCLMHLFEILQSLSTPLLWREEKRKLKQLKQNKFSIKSKCFHLKMVASHSYYIHWRGHL